MKIEFCREILPYNTSDVFRKIAVNQRYVGIAHRGSTGELWSIEINGRRVTTDNYDRFSLTEARKLVRKHFTA